MEDIVTILLRNEIVCGLWASYPVSSCYHTHCPLTYVTVHGGSFRSTRSPITREQRCIKSLANGGAGNRLILEEKA